MTLLGTRALLIGVSAVLALGTGSTCTVAAAASNPATGAPVLVDTGSTEQIRQLVQCGQTIYAVGTFTEIQGYDASTGTMATFDRNGAFSFGATAPFAVSAWNPNVSGTVNSIAINNSCTQAYLGGRFTEVGGAAAKNIASVDTAVGALFPGFDDNSSSEVNTVLLTNGGQHLLTGGFFKGINGSSADPYYASLNPSTGKNDGFLDLNISGHYVYKGVRSNSTEVYNQQLSPDGTLLLVEGDFTSVGGLSRQQIFMLNLTGTTATVTGWSSPAWDGSDPNGGGRYDKYWQCSDSQPFYVQAAAWSPDQSTIYLATTGGTPRKWDGTFPLVGLCDSASAVSAEQEENPPISWTNYTGCGSLFATAAVATAVYVAGDERWADNPDGCKSPGPGSVKAPGLAGYTPGGALMLNAAGTAGLYSRSPGWATLLITGTGLWIGGDLGSGGASCVGGAVPSGICLIPWS